MMAVALGSALLLGAWSRIGVVGRYAGVGAVAAAVHPLWLVAVGIGSLAAQRRNLAPDHSRQLLLLVDQVALGLRAGLTLEGALGEATGSLSGPLAEEVKGVLRQSRLTGLEEALRGASGGASRLYRISDRAVRTGAPLGSAVEALAEELRHDDHARRVASARRLPVRLLLPLALLILPGFVLALVGPALVTSLARLDIGW